MAKKPDDLKAFRQSVKKLADAGIIGRTDARKALPTWVRKVGPKGGTKTLKEIVKQYDDVLSDKVTPVRLSDEETARYRKLGYETVKPAGKKEKVLIPHSADERVIVRRNKVERINPSGITVVQVPCEYHTLPKFLRCLKRNRAKINAMKANDEWFGFRFWGNNSHRYRTIELMIEDLERYDDITRAIKSGKARDMAEQYAHLEIVKIHRSKDWREPEGRSNKASKAAHKRASKRYREKLAKDPVRSADAKRKAADRERQRRASMTKAEKKAYKKAAKKRAKRSRKK